MTVDEIKIRYLVPDVARREGITVTRSGFCRCIYHSEKTASMKLYEHSWYCFGCGRSGDVIDLIKRIHGLAFQDACVYLTGEKAGCRNKMLVAIAKRRQARAERAKIQKQNLLRATNEKISFYRRVMELYEPTDPGQPVPEEYADAIHQYTLHVGVQEELLWE